MIKKLFYSLLLLAFASPSSFAQTTYYLQEGASPSDPVALGSTSNWNTSQTGGGSTPSNFLGTNNWNLNGVANTFVTGTWSLSGTLLNSGSTSEITVNNHTIAFNGSVAAANITISSGVGGGNVTYVSSGASDIIPGTYGTLDIFGGVKTAAGDITVEDNLSHNAAANAILDMGTYDLIDGGSFSPVSSAAAVLTIRTESNSATPIPSAEWPTGIAIVYRGAGTQYVPSGNYDILALTQNGSPTEAHIAPGDTVKIRSNFQVFTSLVLEASSSSNYAQLLSNVGNTSGGGSIEQQLYLDLGASSGRYFHLGSGLIGSPFNSLVEPGATMVGANDPTGSIWQWTGTGADWLSVSNIANNSIPGIGYAIYVGAGTGGPYTRSGSGTVSWVGDDVHTANVSDNLYYFDPPGNDTNFVDPLNDDGWNLRAHPFTSNYDFENQTLVSGMYNSYSVWNGTNYEVYQIGGAGTAPRYIAPGQAVWLRLTGSPISLSFDFEIANATMNSSSVLKSAAVVNDMLGLHVEEVNGTYHDDAFIRLYPQATDADEALYDAAKMFNPGDVPNMYVKLNSGSFAICGANVYRSTFPLYFMDANDGQQMKITISKNTLTSYGRVFIEDKKNNTFTDLTATGSYIFSNDKSYGADRFVIHFESGVGLPEGMIPGATAYDAFYSNGTIQITFQEESFRPTTGSLYNLQGKLVSSFEINDANTSISVPNVATGIYLLAIDGDTAGARKLYINK